MQKTNIFLILLFLTVFCGSASAQRFTDKLDRGLVAIPTGSTDGSKSNLVTWRKLASEYYDVTYNLYKNGTLAASGLTTTTYSDDKNAPNTTEYQVAAVVNGVEQAKSAAIKPWTQYVYKPNETHRYPTAYLDIQLATVTDRDGKDVTADYSANDAELADLDGDGQLEIIIKRLNNADASGSGAATGSYQTDENGEEIVGADGNKIPVLDGGVYSQYSKAFVVIDAYDVDWQSGKATLMWRIDCGPNMVSLNSTEIDVIAYDWDEDGKAEVVLRGADDMIIHKSDGTTQTIGIAGFNFRASSHFNHKDGWQYAWSHFGREYLIYMDGQSGKPYQVIDYPLPRLEQSEWSKLGVSGVEYNDYVALEKAGYGNYFTKNTGALHKAWGDNYGHRSTKYFFGAPFLDGRKASLFLGRGIYTRHKMIAMDLDRGSHQWKERWRWQCNDANSPWYGNGYHNFVVADVDEDGRDEIVYGSMVIDDNGRGLSTTGYQHGDAQHVSDFDPYRKGLEFFGCLEDGPYYGSNYRNATTGQVYWKHTATGDDGRGLMGNFSNDYPGSMGRSVSSNLISSLKDSEIPSLTGDNFIPWGKLNQRIYWDGDLCSEILDSPGTAKEASVDKPGTGRMFTSIGCNMNNSSKNNPCFMGDIIGDWREEIIVRCGSNIRVYTSGIWTSYAMPTLWNDHQYRQAMVWQMMAYNQPPHLSYFLGEMEGITAAPPTLTNDGRTEVANGSTITTTADHLLMAETNDMTVSVADGAAPYMLTVNTPSWVQGTDVDGTSATKVKGDGSVGVKNLPEIQTTYFTHTLTGGAFMGTMRLVKQGDGRLVLPAVKETYTGNTDVWAGTLQFDGTLESSPLWLNRFATLLSDGGTFGGGICAEYGASIVPGGANKQGKITTTSLTLNHGAILSFDIYGTTKTADQLNIGTLTINTKGGDAWTNYGPQYLKPVIRFAQQGGTPADGYYDLGTLDKVEGSLEDILLEGLDGASDARLVHHNGHLWLAVGNQTVKTPAPVITENGLQRSASGLMLPVVNITAADFTFMGSQATPALSAIFTDLQGKESAANIYKTFFTDDFESATDASAWTNGDSSCPLTLESGDAVYGNYIKHSMDPGVSGNRSAYALFGDADLSNIKHYAVEFDAYLKAGTVAERSNTDLVVMSKGAVIPTITNKQVGAGYNGDKCNAAGTNYLFRMTAANSQNFTINESEALTLSAAWTHYLISVDTEARTASYVISRGTEQLAAGTFAIPEGTSTEPYGLFILDGRGKGESRFDNIRIYSTDAYEYAFRQPGTLTVTASYSGCESTTTDYTGAVVLDEEDATAPVAVAGNVPVKVVRSISANEWSTICLPFDMTAEQWAAAFGSDAEIRSLTGYTLADGAVKVKFSNPLTGSMAKNTPYIIKTTKAVDGFELTAELAPAKAETALSNGAMVGVYEAGTAVPANDFFISGNQFFRSHGATKSKAFRAYFRSTDAQNDGQARLLWDFDDAATTGISAVDGGNASQGALFDLQGRPVSETAAQKGVYVRNGKKVVKK